MKAIVLIFAIIAVANCYFVRHPTNDIHWIPKLPKINGKEIGNFSPLIVGGTEAAPHSRPFQVALYITEPAGTFFCGGSLISSEWVLTAAHCTLGATSVEVILGAHDISIQEPTQVTAFSSGVNIHTHEGYDASSLSNDMSLLRLDNPIGYTNEIKPVPLPNAGDADLGADLPVVISGWGATSDPNGQLSNVLKQATVLTISYGDCANYYGGIISDNTVCTAYTDQSGTCFGDSGGPLTYDGTGTVVHRAVTSFVSGAGCESGGPDGFTRTKHFLDWINQITGGIPSP